MRALALALGLSYPFLAHVAVSRSDPALMALAIGVLAAALLRPALARGSLRAWALALLGAGLVALALRADAAAFLLYVPPVALNLLAGLAFARTLAPGQVPLVEQFARVVHGDAPLDPRIPAYARRLTLAWAVLLLGLAAIDLVLALLAVPGGVLDRFGVATPFAVPQSWWSLFANFLGWVAIAAFMLGEWFYRQRRFPVAPYTGMADYARRFAAAGPKLWRGR